MKKITLENGNVVEISEESYNELTKSMSNPYSKYVGRFSHALAIKGEKMLYSFKDGEIRYDDEDTDYIEELKYETVKASDCEFGDVICTELDESKLILEDFEIVIGKDTDGHIITQYLSKFYGVECICDNIYINPIVNVIRFLRR
jgi:hypothetical protein